MPKVVLLTAAATVAPGGAEMHFGFQFVAMESGALECDMPAEFVESEVSAGRVRVVEPQAAATEDKPKKGKE